MSDKAFHEYVMTEIFGSFEGVSSRAMFGGWGIYKDGLIFALIADGQLYFKVDSTNKEDYEKAGSKPFVYEMGNHKKTTMSYWELPENVSEGRELLTIWVEKSVDASRKTKKK